MKDFKVSDLSKKSTLDFVEDMGWATITRRKRVIVMMTEEAFRAALEEVADRVSDKPKKATQQKKPRNKKTSLQEDLF